MAKLYILLIFTLKTSLSWGVSSWDCKPSRFDATLEGEVVLYQSLLSKDPKSDYRKAVLEQFNYLHGLTANVLGSKMVLSSPTDIVINHDREIRSEKEMHIYSTPVAEDATSYVKLALKKKNLPAKSSQRQVTYGLKFNVITCLSEKELLSSFEKIKNLPQDPFLAYWYIDHREFKKQNYLNISEALVNPCASSELADLPQANYFWYFWNPEISSSCRDSYRHHSATTSVSLKPASPSSVEVSLPVNRVAIIHGIVEQHFLPGSMTKVAKLAQRLMQKNETGQGSEFFYVGEDETKLFNLLKHLKLREASLTSIVERKNHLEIELKTPQKEFSIFFGETDHFGLRPPQHDEFFKKELELADMVVYWGHAGLGKNFSISSNIKGKAHTLALLSCYSYRYVDDEKLNRYPASLKRLVATGSDMAEGDRALIQLLDRTIFLKELSPDMRASVDFIFMTELKEKYESL